MKNHHIAFWCLVFLALVPLVRGTKGNPNDAHFWSQVVTEKSLIEIGKTMSEAPQQWPHIDSVNVAPSWQMDLMRNLHRAIGKSFDPAAETRANTEAYLQIASTLSKAGGYSNLLLADSIYRLVIYRAAQGLTISGGDVEKARSLIEKLLVPSVDIKGTLLLFLKDDALLNEQVEKIKDIAPSENIYSVSQRLLSKNEPHDFAALSFSDLLENPSGLSLTLRMAQTEVLVKIGLKSLSKFIQNGGMRSELDPSDITRFTERMGGTQHDYRYLPLGIRRLSVGHPLMVINIAEDQNAQAAFLQSAIK